MVRWSAFTRADVRAMDAQVQALMDTLHALAAPSWPAQATDAALDQLTRDLILHQRHDIPNLAPGSWCIAPDLVGMDADARFDLILLPTLVALGVLNLVRHHRPHLAAQHPRLRQAITHGLQFVALRGLTGPGYDADPGLFTSVELLHLGGLPETLSTDPSLSPPAYQHLQTTAADLAHRLANDLTRGPWNTDFTSNIRTALAQLSPVLPNA